MKRLLLVVPALIALNLPTVSPSIAQQDLSQICSTGPYVFQGISWPTSQILPSTRKFMSALGFAAIRRGCVVRVECAKESGSKEISPQDRRLCNAVRDILMRAHHYDRRVNTDLNRAQRDEINMRILPSVPAGSIRVVLSSGSP